MDSILVYPFRILFTFIERLDEALLRLINQILGSIFIQKLANLYFFVPLLYLIVVAYHSSTQYYYKLFYKYTLLHGKNVNGLSSTSNLDTPSSISFKSTSGSNKQSSSSERKKKSFLKKDRIRHTASNIKSKNDQIIATTKDPKGNDDHPTSASENSKSMNDSMKIKESWKKKWKTVSILLFKSILYLLVTLFLQQWFLVLVMKLYLNHSTITWDDISLFQLFIFSPEKYCSYLMANMIALPIYNYLSSNLFSGESFIKKHIKFDLEYNFLSLFTLYYCTNNLIYYSIRRSLRNLSKTSLSLPTHVFFTLVILLVHLFYEPWIHSKYGAWIDKKIHLFLLSLSKSYLFPSILILVFSALLSNRDIIDGLWNLLKSDFQFTTVYYICFMAFSNSMTNWTKSMVNSNVFQNKNLSSIWLVFGELSFFLLLKLGEVVCIQSPSTLLMDLPYQMVFE